MNTFFHSLFKFGVVAMILGMMMSTSVLAETTALNNTFVKLTEKKKLKVVVIGNSVTAGAPEGKKAVPSFYVAMEKWLREKFPDAQIEVVPKIIYAIGPEVQVFRMDERVLAEKPDLVLAEFGAANGAWGDKGSPVTEPATEGFIRRLREKSPETDCILMMGIFKTMMDDYSQGKTPRSAEFLHKLAEQYQCVAVDAGAVVANRIVKGGEKWEDYMNDFIHPGDKGYELYSQILIQELEKQYKSCEKMSALLIHHHQLPAKTLVAVPWTNPIFIPASEAKYDGNFKIEQTENLKYLAASQVGASGSFTAPKNGKVVGLYMRFPDKCGNLEIKSGNDWVRLSQKGEPHFTEKEDPKNKRFRNFFKAYGLPLGMEKIEFRVSENPEVEGAKNVQIIGFFVIEHTASKLVE